MSTFKINSFKTVKIKLFSLCLKNKIEIKISEELQLVYGLQKGTHGKQEPSLKNGENVQMFCTLHHTCYWKLKSENGKKNSFIWNARQLIPVQFSL